MQSLDVTDISIPDTGTIFIGDNLRPPLPNANITEFIEGNPLSSDKKIDQIRLNVINTGFFKLHISSSKLTEIIQGRNSQIHWNLKDITDGYGIVIHEIRDAFKQLYTSLGLNIEPKVLLTKISFSGGKKWDKHGKEKPKASYTIHTDIGSFVIQFTNVFPFNILLMFNPTRLSKGVYGAKGNEIDDLNTLDTGAIKDYESIINTLLTETNLSRFLMEPFFKFLITYRDLQRFKFRYWLAYVEANVDINTFGHNRIKIIRSCDDIIQCFSNKVEMRYIQDENRIMITGDHRAEGCLQFKIYTKADHYVRAELTYGKEYMKDVKIHRRLPYNWKDMNNGLNAFSDIINHATNFLNVISSHIQKQMQQTNDDNIPTWLEDNYISTIRQMFSSPTKYKVITFLLQTPQKLLKREDICQKAGLEGYQVSNVLRQIPFLIKRLPNSHKFEVIPKAKMIFKELVDFFRKEAFAIYELAGTIENEVLKNAKGLWRYYKGIFSTAPGYSTFNDLKFLEMQMDHAIEMIAGMPEFSENRIIANSY